MLCVLTHWRPSSTDVEANRSQNVFFNNTVLTHKGVQMHFKSSRTEGWYRILVHQRTTEAIGVTFEVSNRCLPLPPSLPLSLSLCASPPCCTPLNHLALMLHRPTMHRQCPVSSTTIQYQRWKQLAGEVAAHSSPMVQRAGFV